MLTEEMVQRAIIPCPSQIAMQSLEPPGVGLGQFADPFGEPLGAEIDTAADRPALSGHAQSRDLKGAPRRIDLGTLGQPIDQQIFRLQMRDKEGVAMLDEPAATAAQGALVGVGGQLGVQIAIEVYQGIASGLLQIASLSDIDQTALGDDFLDRMQPTLAGTGADADRLAPALRRFEITVPERPRPALPRPVIVNDAADAMPKKDAIAVGPLPQTAPPTDPPHVLVLDLLDALIEASGKADDLLGVDPDVARLAVAAMAALRAGKTKAVPVPFRSGRIGPCVTFSLAGQSTCLRLITGRLPSLTRDWRIGKRPPTGRGAMLSSAPPG